jgi:hypothetical protein
MADRQRSQRRRRRERQWNRVRRRHTPQQRQNRTPGPRGPAVMAAMTTAVIARPRRAIRREGPLAGTDDIGHSRMMTSERGETAEVE